jgi:hypothetical protein
MRLENPQDYILDHLQVAQDGRHKYVAVMTSLDTGKTKRIPFGALGYGQYNDKIGEYSDLDNNDPRRREAWLKRHAQNIKYPYSSAWWAWKVLW